MVAFPGTTATDLPLTKATDKSDVIVIGGGHNGLVCACYLAKAGLRVRVLERRSIVGGAAVTEEFHPGFRNSTASYTVGLLSPQVIHDLHLKSHGVRFVPRPVANFLPLGDDESLTIFNDDARTAREFARFSANDAAMPYPASAPWCARSVAWYAGRWIARRPMWAVVLATS